MLPRDIDRPRVPRPAPRVTQRHSLLGLASAALVAASLMLGGTSTRAACVACHASSVPREGVAAAHARLSCYRCHLAEGAWSWPAFKARELLVMYPRALQGARALRDTDPVSDRACRSCHGRVMDGVVESVGIRIAHASCAVGRTCGSCHGVSAHGTALRWARQAIMEECVACHRTSGASTSCDGCHVERSERRRLEKGPWQITHGPTWSKTHGMGTLEWCATCHPRGYCVRCHGVDLPHPADFGRTHGALARSADARCETCHDRRALCDACHGIEMPHPGGFLARHSKEASTASDPRCLACHIAKDCTACHVKHIHPGATRGTAPLPRPEDIGLEGTP